MTFHQLKCPNCGATLNVDNGLDTFFCQYCGTKLISDGQSDVAIRAKADIILADKALEKEKLQQEYEERTRKLDLALEAKEFLLVIGGIALFVYLFTHVI